MKYRRVVMLPVVALTAVCAADTQSVTVNAVTHLDENASVIWRTIKTSPSQIALDWPQGAASAVLTTKIGSGAAQSAVIDNTSATSCNVVFAIPSAVEEREIVTLSISYLDGDGTEISSQTARLGLVDGVGNGASVATPLSSGGDWLRFDGHRVVQIPADATAVALDGAPVDCDVPGWYDLITSPGRHTLAYETADGVSSAIVLKNGSGMVIIFR